MKIGFTGTQQGMSSLQKEQLRDILSVVGFGEFHHGDCIGADAQAHSIARSLGFTIVVHPPLPLPLPKGDAKRAFCNGDRTFPALDHLARNKVIVDSVELLVAAPKGDKEEKRSGTWATIRYARKKNKPIHLLER